MVTPADIFLPPSHLTSFCSAYYHPATQQPHLILLSRWPPGSSLQTPAEQPNIDPASHPYLQPTATQPTIIGDDWLLFFPLGSLMAAKWACLLPSGPQLTYSCNCLPLAPTAPAEQANIDPAFPLPLQPTAASILVMFFFSAHWAAIWLPTDSASANRSGLPDRSKDAPATPLPPRALTPADRYSPHSGLAEQLNIASASPLPPQPPATQADHNR
ncbi:hypothetical protein PGTUg99_026100 [Puccinia graminis f. sp. tritici]|uniref:Uncharacterized protein n=1 Tax=Puccinia graminis f. sp. tritici TaxID=56615 RepID=A0A5B0LVQ1_PUCGR|nr:hypothetical protein PGTUg99_026100 [Puccinia graminis f. sp. tritici]